MTYFSMLTSSLVGKYLESTEPVFEHNSLFIEVRENEYGRSTQNEEPNTFCT